jgi:hypothetical protein
MRPTTVVIVAPRLDGCARLGQTQEYMLIEAFVAQAAIERFHEGFLHGLAGLSAGSSPIAAATVAANMPRTKVVSSAAGIIWSPPRNFAPLRSQSKIGDNFVQ